MSATQLHIAEGSTVFVILRVNNKWRIGVQTHYHKSERGPIIRELQSGRPICPIFTIPQALHMAFALIVTSISATFRAMITRR